MNNTYSFIKSRTFWTIIITVVISAANAISPFMSDSAQTFIQAILSVLAIFFHVDTATKAGATN